MGRVAFVLRQILWPCDLGRTSARSLEHAIALARITGAEIRAFHVVAATLPPSGGLFSMPNPALLDPQLLTRLAGELERRLKPARAARVAAKTEVRVGRPVQEILRLASNLPADLLVMGAAAHGRLERWWLGSVTERVLRDAPCPVLVVRGTRRTATAPFHTILCATDFGKRADAAFRSAAQLARAGGARLLLAHVIEGIPEKEPSATSARPGAWAAVEARARAALRAALAEATGTPWRRGQVEPIVARGRPHEAILRLARERRADLIVAGRGRSGLLTLGSCARRITEAAACPVLLVPGK